MPARIGSLINLPARYRDQVAAKEAAGSVVGGGSRAKSIASRRPPAKPSQSDLELHLLGQIRALRLIPPRQQYRFDIERRWRADFAWVDELLLVEVDGGTWTAGRHVRGAGYDADRRRDCEAVASGWRVLRVTGDMVRDGTAVEFIRRVLEQWEPPA